MARFLALLWPEEGIALVYLAMVLAAFRVAGYPFTGWPMAVEYLRFFGAILAVTLPLWVAVQVYRAWRRRFRWREAGLDLVRFARALAALLVVLVAYTNLKARLFLFAPRLLDGLLERLDAWVHFGGGDFVGWTLGFTHDAGRNALLAWAYLLAWAVFALPLGAAFARDGGPAARRALAALGLAYVIGSLFYLAFPSMGPAFYVRARYAHLADNWAWQTQEQMRQALLYLVQHPAAPAVPFFGIAAFPSLHAATTGLGALICWRHARWLLAVIVPANLLVAWSAVHFGWHYAIDLYPGFALAALAWWVAGRWVASEGWTPARGASRS